MRVDTVRMLRALLALSWIILIGVLINAGILITGVLITTFVAPAAKAKMWVEPDLSALFQTDPGHFFAQSLMMLIVAVMKAILFYLIVKILQEKKLNMAQPFSQEMGRFIFMISYITLLIGLFSAWGANYAKWLSEKGISMPDAHRMHLDGADVWLFMSVTLFVIAHIFKRGVEIQNENELTV